METLVELQARYDALRLSNPNPATTVSLPLPLWPFLSFWLTHW